MPIKVSKTLRVQIHNAALQLCPDKPLVWLKEPFSGFYVSLDNSKKYPSEIYSYREEDIDREGEFYLVCFNLMGHRQVDDEKI